MRKKQDSAHMNKLEHLVKFDERNLLSAVFVFLGQMDIGD